MFRDTNHFFEEVYNGNANDIDIKNFLYVLTEDDDYSLFLVKKDLMFFIFRKTDELESKFNKEDLTNEIEKYYSKGENPPTKKSINHISKKLNERNGDKVFDEEYEYFDLEKMFYPHDLFCIKQLDNLIESMLNKKDTQINKKPKHENIFCNNGFELFEYILTNHIAEDRGRINDISFYYWKMFNDNYIIQRPFVFVEWFMNFYDKENFQIKTLVNARSVNRLKHYSNSLDWFKLQNQ
jgi:hypothetical protein